MVISPTIEGGTVELTQISLHADGSQCAAVFSELDSNL